MHKIQIYHQSIRNLRIAPMDQVFCDKNFAQIILGIKIVWKFLSEGVIE